MQSWTDAKHYSDPEKMAAEYLARYYGDEKVEYPINPFKMLKDEGILFSLRNFNKLEGVDITVEQAAEIVTDLRLNMQNSDYCREENEAFLSIAGHFDMYQEIFAVPVKNTLSIYDTFALNKKLFSHYPYPEYGGNVRQNNTLVFGAKFETAD